MVAPVDLIGQFFYIGIGGRAAQRQFSALLTEVDEAAKSDGAAAGSPGNDAPGSFGNDASDSSTNAGPGGQAQPPPDGAERPAMPALQLRQVTAGWDEGAPVLQDITVQVAEGEHLALVGPSGSGKSTLSAVIQGLISPFEGEVLLRGRPHRVDHRPPSSGRTGSGPGPGC